MSGSGEIPSETRGFEENSLHLVNDRQGSNGIVVLYPGIYGPTLTNLPPELILMIMEFLSLPDALKLSYGNRMLSGIVKDRWKTVLKNIKPEDKINISNFLLDSIRNEEERIVKSTLDKYYEHSLPANLKLNINNKIAFRFGLNDSLLHIAARLGNLNIVKFLVDIAKMEVNEKIDNGQTPLHHAAREGHVNIVKFLVERKRIQT